MTVDAQTLERPAPDQRRVRVIVALGFVVLLSVVQLYISAMVIPRFADIFQDMLGGRPLPTATATVLNFRWALVGVACGLSLAASFVVQRRASLRYLFAILAILLLQIAFVTVVLFLPLVGDIQAIAPTQ
jgi:type II secretory pathway component PulF